MTAMVTCNGSRCQDQSPVRLELIFFVNWALKAIPLLCTICHQPKQEASVLWAQILACSQANNNAKGLAGGGMIWEGKKKWQEMINTLLSGVLPCLDKQLVKSCRLEETHLTFPLWQAVWHPLPSPPWLLKCNIGNWRPVWKASRVFEVVCQGVFHVTVQ